MEYLQYKEVIDMADLERLVEVLNLIINGIPSIQLFNETIGDILEF